MAARENEGRSVELEIEDDTRMCEKVLGARGEGRRK